MNKYAYFGNDDNSLAFLQSLKQEYYPDIIITGEPRRSGRGRKLKEAPPVSFARHQSIPFIEIPCKSHRDIAEKLNSMDLDYFLVFSYGCLIPECILNIPRHMSVNIHPSLLPGLRGAAPINRAIMNGAEKTGVSFFKMVKKMDAGPLIIQEEIPIDNSMTSIDLKAKLISQAASMFMSFDWTSEFPLEKQKEDKVTYAKKIEKHELTFNINEDAEKAVNRINGLAENGVKIHFGKRMFKLRKALLVSNEAKNSDICLTVNNRELLLKYRKGIIKILKIQSAGKKIVSSKEFINGNQLTDGDTICAEYSE